jgi:hypothetical protein
MGIARIALPIGPRRPEHRVPLKAEAVARK